MYNSAIKMFEYTAGRLPEHTAVIEGERSVTFGQLRSAARKTASAILKAVRGRNGVSPVVIYLPKSIEALQCQLGAMYSGSPYVPVNPAEPVGRLQTILAGIGQHVIITNAKLKEKLEALETAPDPEALLLVEEIESCAADEAAIAAAVAQVTDTDPCYIIYTSGSTGVPKGVTIPHRGFMDFARWLGDTFRFDEHTVLGNESNFDFDLSVTDICTMCYTGATLNLIPEILLRFPQQFMDYVDEQKITSLTVVPTVLTAIANSGTLEGRTMPHLKTVLFCGETMPNRQLNVWRRALPDTLYVNTYGPTETTVLCTCYIVDRPFADSDPLPIGKACRNMRVLILNEQDAPCAVGEKGELCVLGSGISTGYWNNPEQTDKVFVQNPLNTRYPERMYRTGDLGFLAPDGNIEFVGRKDFQIKRRGSRIEPGDIETAARCVEHVKNACVVYDPDTEDIILCLETTENLILRKVNQVLRKQLPAYMLPTRLCCLEELPKTANGKISRSKLKIAIGVE